MINVVFCYEQETMFHYVYQTVQMGFSHRGISIHAISVTHPRELLDYAAKGIFPDIFLFSNETYQEVVWKTILFLQQNNHSVLCILTKYSESIDKSIKETHHFLFPSFYEISFPSHKQLWNGVSNAYDISFCDLDTFTYYRRPSYHSTPLNHILYFTSEGRCIRLVSQNGNDSFYGKINELEKNLCMKNCRFVRIHQSYLVNTKFIASFTHRNLTLLTGEELHISRPDYYQEVKRVLRKR